MEREKDDPLRDADLKKKSRFDIDFVKKTQNSFYKSLFST